MENIDYTRHYKNWHNDTPEHVSNMIKFYLDNVIIYFPKNKEIRILDIGCGMGFLLLALKEKGYKNVKGIDIDEGQIKSCLGKGLDVEKIDDTIQYLDKNKEEYDIICAFDVLEHISPSEQIKFISKINGSLKNSGVFIGSVPNANSILASRNRYIDYTHYVTFTEISLDFVLFNGDFNKIEIIEMDFVKLNYSPLKILRWFVFKTFRIFRRMAFVAELGKDGIKIPLSFNLIFKAKK
jgi:2-polyprenyl-3-methyl-5-hydroxy-6-metoxy-1,4-benzoquinol methylase